jgi:hypothetical protein
MNIKQALDIAIPIVETHAGTDEEKAALTALQAFRQAVGEQIEALETAHANRSAIKVVSAVPRNLTGGH